MYLQTFHTPGLSINSYLVADTQSKRAVIIDPTTQIDYYIDFAQKEGFTITDIAETHVHADFISGSQELKARLQNKPIIHCSALGGPEWTPKYTDHKVLEGESINLGNVKLQAMHTPGHTPEHLIWICYDESEKRDQPCIAFSGDLLFVGSVGRPDLLGSDSVKQLAQQLYHSLFEKLSILPDFLEIYPAHGAGSLCGKGLSARPTTTLGYERLYNPYLIHSPIEEWIKKLLNDIPGAPLNFARMKKMNVIGSSGISKNKSNDSISIDLRNPEVFAKAYLKNTINIPYGGAFCNWVSSIIEKDCTVNLIGDSLDQLNHAAEDLKLIGLDQVNKSLWDDVKSESRSDIESFPLWSAEQLAEKIKEFDFLKSHYILDVRTNGEWNSGHIPEAHHLELARITKNLDSIPKDKTICTLCGGGYRASIVASFLKKMGYQNVINLRGGMSAWHQAKLPVDKTIS